METDPILTKWFGAVRHSDTLPPRRATGAGVAEADAWRRDGSVEDVGRAIASVLRVRYELMRRVCDAAARSALQDTHGARDELIETARALGGEAWSQNINTAWSAKAVLVTRWARAQTATPAQEAVAAQRELTRAEVPDAQWHRMLPTNRADIMAREVGREWSDIAEREAEHWGCKHLSNSA